MDRNKIQRTTDIAQRTLPNFKQVQLEKEQKADIRHKILPIYILISLGAWIGLCFYTNSSLLDTALVCSSIILCLLFFGTAEQQEDYRENVER